MDNNPGSDTLTLARDAADRRIWHEAYDLLSAADAGAPLGAEDLVRLTEAAWWTGRIDDAIASAERAFAVASGEGNPALAALIALDLSGYHDHKLARSVARGWASRAERLLQDIPECPAHGYLARLRSNRLLEEGKFDESLEQARLTLEIGMRLGHRDLQALGLHQQGIVLVARGDVQEGLQLLEEAAVAAVSGELSPQPTATIYCNVISTCRDLADYRRAGEWTDAARRWCERQAISGFPGHCRVYRAEIMRLRGAWAEAEQEIRRACEELRPWSPMFTGEGFAELGEIRLRVGDYAAARESFHMAAELGANPQPGLAMLDLAEGNVAAAAAGIKRALEEDSWDRLHRSRLLPARVVIALATGDLASAGEAAAEMETIADTFQSSAIIASARCVRGAVQTAEGDHASAIRTLRSALRLWQEVEAPYEAAECRVRLAEAYLAAADQESAALELRAARSAFERLGAAPGLERAARLLDNLAGAPGGASRTRQVRAFMFTDICSSTPLVEAIGDEAWEDLLRWHDGMLRECFAAHRGEEIKHGGDGFFVAFNDAASAIDCAIRIQRRLADHRRDHGFSPQVRIGIHAAEATSRGKDYVGKGVNVAARIGALADAGGILVSRETAPNGDWNISQPRQVTLRGIAGPVEIVSIDWH